ncbi:MAG: ATP synthase F1 subunit delta [Ferruginibacter sp.]|nr:ATP synthase F1 subunit delta [Ferruginibacter sp.]
MSNPRLAGRYAKSLLDLALERNQLEEVYSDVKLLQSICKTNSDFVNVLKSPVIGPEKKDKIFDSITAGKVNELTSAFLKLLVNKTRESNLPEIVKAFTYQYNEYKGIKEVKITTAVPMSSDLQEIILQKIKSNTPYKEVQLQTAVKDELIGGFTLEVGDTLIDASILRDLNDVKKQFKNNEYIHNIR